jgi:hypothetical protein
LKSASFLVELNLYIDTLMIDIWTNWARKRGYWPTGPSLFIVSSIYCLISVGHICSNTCNLSSNFNLTFHDFSNSLFCYNIYCINKLLIIINGLITGWLILFVLHIHMFKYSWQQTLQIEIIIQKTNFFEKITKYGNVNINYTVWSKYHSLSTQLSQKIDTNIESSTIGTEIMFLMIEITTDLFDYTIPQMCSEVNCLAYSYGHYRKYSKLLM